MKKLNTLLSMIMLSLFLSIGINSAFATVVTVTLVDENGTALANYPPSGSEMSYKYRCGGSWVGGGNVQTDASGQFLTSDITCSNWDGKITLGLHQRSKEKIVTGGAVTFQAARVNVNLKNECTGLVTATDGTVEQGGAHWYTHGSTAGTGVVSFYTFPGGTVKVKMNYHWKSVTQNSVAIVAGTNEVDFLTTNVNIAFSGTVKYKTGGWPTVTFPIELLQATHTFKFSQSGQTTFTKSFAVSGCTLTKNMVHIKLLSSTGTGIPGGTVRYWATGNWRSAGLENGGVTDANGVVIGDIPAGVTKFRMSYYNTFQEKITSTSYVTFTTVNLEAELLSSSGNPLSGGLAHFWGYGNWRTIGTTDATGRTDREVLPGNYKLHMGYKWTYTTTAPIDFTSNATYTFTTTKAEVKLETCGGVSLAGGSAKYWGYGNWRPMVETSTGYFTQEILTGDQQAFNIRMGYKWVSNEYVHDVTVGAYTFNTTNVTLQFSGNIKYYAYGNHRTFTKPSMELLPGSYLFEYFSSLPMQTQTQTVSSCSIVKSLVIIELEDSNGDGLEGGIAKYNKGGWQTAGTTGPNGYVLALIDGLQNTLDFRMYWEGTYIHKYQNIKTNSLVKFQTKEVSVSLLASDGTTELTGVGKVNSGGWKTIGNTPGATIELLPRTYDFRIYYEGSYIHKYQNVGSTSKVQFQTKLVSMSLLASDGTTELTGVGKVNSGGWKVIGNTPTATMELLPKKYDFRIYYEGSYIHKYQNVTSTPKVQFQTKLVSMSLLASNGTTELTGVGKVNSGGWKVIGSTPAATMELLPRTYDFRIYYAGSYIHKYQNVTSTPKIQFQTVLVTTELVDGSSNPITGGEGKVNSGGWTSLGFTPFATMELLPKTYDFRMYYLGSYTHKYQNVASNNTVTFTYNGGFKNAGFKPDYTTMLNKVYPNPFNTTTTLEFSIEKEQKVMVVVFDIRGKLVKTLMDQNLSEGEHSITWNSQDDSGGDVKQGVYIVKLVTEASVQQKTIVKAR